MAFLQSLPFFVVLMGIGSLAMPVPALYAYFADDMHSARVFLYGGILFLVLTALIGIATSNSSRRPAVRGHLPFLMAAYLILPVMLAIPVYETIPDIRFLDAYFEMVSSFTTTGASLFDDPSAIPNALNLWRAIVGWLGGLFIWISAIAILAPLNLGGFEVSTKGGIGEVEEGPPVPGASAVSPRRLAYHAGALAPVYIGLTAFLWLFLTVIGEDPFVALCHAMSTLATSGISPLADMSGSSAGVPGEAVMFVFFIFAVSRLTFAPERRRDILPGLWRDPEFRLGLFFVLASAGILFVTYWMAVHGVSEDWNLTEALFTLWGSLFTAMSFLTTSGFESAHWEASRHWPGLGTPGLILIALSLVGGGVATTAGGMKLLRYFALYKHGVREFELMVHPSSVGGIGSKAIQPRNRGAYKAWVFFMLFTISIAVAMLAFSLAGVSVDDSIILAASALSTTGPLVGIATDPGISYASLNDASKLIVMTAMILGRLETLAIIALISPEFWRS